MNELTFIYWRIQVVLLTPVTPGIRVFVHEKKMERRLQGMGSNQSRIYLKRRIFIVYIITHYIGKTNTCVMK